MIDKVYCLKSTFRPACKNRNVRDELLMEFRKPVVRLKLTDDGKLRVNDDIDNHIQF